MVYTRMSERGINGSPNQVGTSKGINVPTVESMSKYPFNGLTFSQSTSRGSSPAPLITSVPASQLPSSRMIPASQLPPSSVMNSVTQKVSQLSVQNSLLTNVIKPQFTSTPNETVGLQNKNVNLGSGDFSPITSKIDNNISVVQQNFQEIPLNEKKSASNSNHGMETNSKSQMGTISDDANNVNRYQEPRMTLDNINISDNKVAQMQPMKFSNQLFQYDQRNSFNINPKTSNLQHPDSQPVLRHVETSSMESQQLQSQNLKHSGIQTLGVANSASQNLQNVQSSTVNLTSQPKIQPVSTIPGQMNQNVHSSLFPGHTAMKTQAFNNVSKEIPAHSVPSVTYPSISSQSNVLPKASGIPPSLSQTPLLLNQGPSSNNFRPQKHPMPPTGSSQASVGMPAVMTVPNIKSIHDKKATTGPYSSTCGAEDIKMPQVAQIFQNNKTGLNHQLPKPPGVPPGPNIQQQTRIPPLNQSVAPLSQNHSPTYVKSMVHSNRYPPLPMQRVPSQQNQQPVYNQQYRTQPVQDQQYNTIPTVGYNQPNQNQFQHQYPGQSVVSQGFNKLWGAENYDLLQTANILPTNKIVPPQIMLGNDTLNSANCNGEIFRSTITKIPESQSLLHKSRLPLGILIHPFKDLTQLSVIQCNVIVRCRACRTYINPFVFFVDSKRWKCNLCYRVNDLPEEFQYDPVSKTYGDPSRRPEIKSSTIEYIAPAEYMLRPPQPAVYLFLLDVSRLAVECGYLKLFCSVLQKELLNLPGDSRTQVGFITYDSCLHFFSFAEGLSQPHEMMVLDVDDIFLPCPDNLLVNLKDRIELIRDLLNQLPTRYNNNYDSNSALGAALQAAHRMLSATGGRVTVFQASLPNVGPGALTPREDPNQRASTEVHNLKPANDFYKRLALDCSSQQIAVDLFIVNSQYVDIATISGISRFSGGCIHHFPLFKFGRPILTEKLERSFTRYITRKIGFEAVMRIRCTRGMSIHTFHGNFFVRSTDLLSLPNVNPDSGYGMQVSIDENLSDVESVCFQAALLYTSSKGERRIRVHTLCLPVVSNLHDVLNAADQQCIVGLLAKMAVDRSIESSLSDAREAFINVAIDILSSYKLSLNLGSIPNGLLAPNCLKLLPLYISALLKNQAFRTGTSTRLDDRVKAMIDMKTKPLPWLMQNIYPNLYPIHNLEEQQVILNLEEPIHVPPLLQLTSRLIDNNGAYLMDTGDHMMLYVCSGVSQVFLKEGLGVPNFNSLDDQMYVIPIIENQTNQRLVSFINYLNEEKPYKATLQIIKDNSPGRGVFLERLIEDRVENALSYHEFLQHVKAQVK